MSAARSLSHAESQHRQTAAWEAYRALNRALAADPSLAVNPYFTALRDAGYARFRAEFEAGS